RDRARACWSERCDCASCTSLRNADRLVHKSFVLGTRVDQRGSITRASRDRHFCQLLPPPAKRASTSAPRRSAKASLGGATCAGSLSLSSRRPFCSLPQPRRRPAQARQRSERTTTKKQWRSFKPRWQREH